MLGAFAWETQNSRYSLKDYILRMQCVNETAAIRMPAFSSLMAGSNLCSLRYVQANRIQKALRRYVLAEADRFSEFLEGYYGRAAVPIRKYIRLLREDVPRQKAHIGIYDDPGEYLSQSFLDEADRLWDEAENLAENEAELRRIRKSRLSVRFAKARKTDPAVPGRAEDVEKLIGDIRAFGIGYIRESQKLEDSFDILRRNEGY